MSVCLLLIVLVLKWLLGLTNFGGCYIFALGSVSGCVLVDWFATLQLFVLFC